MNKNDILNIFNIVEWRESENLEFKLSTREIKDIVQTAVAFANTRGGLVLAGVSDDGVIVGQDLSDATLREMAQTIQGNSMERLYPQIQWLSVEDKQILAVYVDASPLSPHLAYGRPFKRVGSVNVQIDQSEYHLMLSRKQNGGGADRDILTELKIDQISQSRISDFINRANLARNLNLPIYSTVKEVLQSLELISSGDELYKGAALLFGDNVQKFIPQAEFRVGHFKDSNRDVFLAQRIFGGTLLEQLDSVLGFVKDRLPQVIDARLVKGRVQNAVPLAAVHELVVNALIHRDYRDPASSYLNIIGADATSALELEISNPGFLMAPQLDPHSMHLQHPSLPVNRRLARAFFMLGLLEQWGQGTCRVHRLVSEAGLPGPVWISERGTVTVRVRLQADFRNAV